MPTRAMRVCQKPGCGRLCDGRFCALHVDADPRAAARKAFDQARGSSTRRGYGSVHRKLRKIVIARDPLCKVNVLCSAITPALSTDADHIIARSRGGTNSLDNLQGACHACHSYKTALEDSAFVRPRSEGNKRDRSKRVDAVAQGVGGSKSLKTRSLETAATVTNTHPRNGNFLCHGAQVSARSH